MSTQTVWLNGTDITSKLGLIAYAINGCTYRMLYAWASQDSPNPSLPGSYYPTNPPPLALGKNILKMKACTGTGVDQACAIDSTILVSSNVTVAARATTVYRVAGTQAAEVFTVRNVGTSTATFALTGICGSTGVTNCAARPTSVTLVAGDSSADTVTYTAPSTMGASGSVTLKATYGANVLTESATTTVIGGWQPKLSVNTDATIGLGRFDGACDHGCFTGTAGFATVPYYSGGSPRNVSFEYSVDRAIPRPFIFADVSLAAGASAVSEIQMQVVDTTTANKKIEFLNGDVVLRFAPGAVASKTVRLAGQFDAVANGYSTTRLLPLQVLVKVIYADNPTNHIDSITTRLQIPILSPNIHRIAKGWAVSGLPRIFEQPDGTALVVEGNSHVYWFAKGQSGYVTPAEEYSTLRVSSPSPATNGDTSRTWTRILTDSTRQEFNYLGYLRSMTNSFGLRTTYQYGAQGELITIVDPIRANTWITLAYDANGLSQISETIPQSAAPSGWVTEMGHTSAWIPGRVTLVGVNATGYLTSVQDPDNVQSFFGYDSIGRLKTISDRRGQTMIYVYTTGSSNRLASILAPSITARNAANTADSVASPRTTLGAWQSVGVPQAATAGVALASLPAAVSVDTIRATIVDAGGHTTRFTVDRFGQPLVVTEPYGRATTFTRNGGLRTLQINYPTGSTETWTYSGPFLTGYGKTGANSIGFKYGPYGVVDTVQVGGITTSTNFIGTGGQIDSASINGVITRFRYDSFGRPTVVIGAKSDTTRLFYDALTGNADSVRSPEGRGGYTLFDVYGRTWIRRVVGADEADTTLYDGLNRITSFHDGKNSAPTRYVYDGGLLLKVIDPRGQTYKTEYNALGWPTREYAAYSTDSATAKYTSTAYTMDGLVVTLTNRRRQPVTFGYDSLHRAIARIAAGVNDSLAYSVNGLVATSWNAVATDSAFLQGTGLPDSVVTRIHGKRFSQRYTYDNTLRLVKTINSGPQGAGLKDRNWWYSPYGVLDSLGVGSSRVKLQRDAAGMVNAINWPSGPQQNFTWTADRLLSKSAFSVTGVDTAMTRSYGYDWASRPNSVTRPQGQPAQEYVFVYDKIGHLSTARRGHYEPQSVCNTDPNDPTALPTCETIQAFVNDAQADLAYDEASNLTQQAGGGSWPSISGTYSIGNAQAIWGSTNYTYDDDGNRLTKTAGGVTTTYNWSPVGTLTSVTQGSQTVSYDYDASGGLVARQVSSDRTRNRYYIWDQGQLLAELDSSAITRVSEYAYGSSGDNPIMMISGDTIAPRQYNIEVDALGNVIGMFNSTRAVQSFTYDPWGKGEYFSSNVSDTTRLRWKGLLFEDGVPQLYYARARWYDPDARRFLSEDPLGIGGGISLYGFGEGNPISFADPTGMCRTYLVGSVSGRVYGEGPEAVPNETMSYRGETWICGDDGVQWWRCPAIGCSRIGGAGEWPPWMELDAENRALPAKEVQDCGWAKNGDIGKALTDLYQKSITNSPHEEALGFKRTDPYHVVSWSAGSGSCGKTNAEYKPGAMILAAHAHPPCPGSRPNNADTHDSGSAYTLGVTSVAISAEWILWNNPDGSAYKCRR